MTTWQVANDTSERIEVFAVDGATPAVGVSGATITLCIRRKDNGQWWTGSGWSSSKSSVTMAQTDSSLYPGHYHYDLPSTIRDAQLSLEAATSDTTVKNGPWSGTLRVGNPELASTAATLSSIAAITPKITRMESEFLRIEKDIQSMFRQLAIILDRIKANRPE